MKKIVFSKEICYSKKIKMKSYIKFFLACSLSIFCTAALVVGTTIAVVHHNNYSGQGGLDGLQPPVVLSQTDLYPVTEGERLAVGASFAGDVQNLPVMPVEPVENIAAGTVIEQAETTDIIEENNADTRQDSGLSYFSYRVKKGDIIGLIAQEYNVTEDTIISVNNIKSSRTLQVGQYLRIPSMPGILYTVKNDGETVNAIATRFKVDAEKTSAANGVDMAAALTAGRTIFVADAKMDPYTKMEINGDLFKNPLHSSYYVSSRFGWRVSPFDASKRTYHGGIDMACPQGTSIYPSAEGTVITAAWSNIYGNYVILEHNSGYKTLYGHMSKITCTKGQYVYQSTVIGKVGSTGQSTGPHLHFTVYKNDRSINPESRVNFSIK